MSNPTDTNQAKTFTAYYKIDEAWLKRVEEWHRLPWYKRIFRRLK